MRASLLLLPLVACSSEAPTDKATTPVDSGEVDTGGNDSIDADGDGYTSDVDCDDADPAVNPGATEQCNDLDDDCDGETDEGLEQSWWVDGDGDGFGSGVVVLACQQPEQTVDNDDDCNDEDALVFPDAEEVCNGLDDDCDDEIDEGLDETWHADGDGDGFGDPAVSVSDCDPGSGWVLDATDCDDSRADRRPDAVTDYCDGLDNDCDGAVDEDVKAGWILLSVDSDAREVVEIDPTTAATTVLAPITGTYSGSLNSMDVRANDGLSIVHDSAGFVHGLDACTGQLTLIGATGTGDMGGVSFAGTGVLYGLNQSSDQLMQIDPFTGAATAIGPLGFGLSASGIAYDCSTDTLYGADSSGMVFQVDTTTGLLHSFVTTRVPFAGVGLEFDPVSGQLLAATGRGNSLYSVDPITGTSTRIGALGTRNANDLALHPACP